jgi:hypothetical protein
VVDLNHTTAKQPGFLPFHWTKILKNRQKS